MYGCWALIASSIETWEILVCVKMGGEEDGEGAYGKPLRRIKDPRLNILSCCHSIDRSCDGHGFHILAIRSDTFQQFQSPIITLKSAFPFSQNMSGTGRSKTLTH